jgi:hypothetical protein
MASRGELVASFDSLRMNGEREPVRVYEVRWGE